MNLKPQTILKKSLTNYHKSFSKPKREQNKQKLIQVIQLIFDNQISYLITNHKAHKLRGIYAGCWSCHIRGDWILIWKWTGNILELVDTGTHNSIPGYIKENYDV